jgi:MoaA/NifB/PqqE/SkfB family radical SAM enzyme
LQGAKRVFDTKALYAQLVITDDCNLSCGYCNEYIPGALPVPLATLQERVDKLQALGVLVYDLLGGEPLLHPHLVALIRYMKTRGQQRNIVVLITNGFLLTSKKVAALNDVGLDMMQISVDSIAPTASSHKALKTVLPKLHMLAREARFSVKVQSVLTEQTYRQYDEFRQLLAALPFDFSFSLLHRPGGHIAIQGEQYVACWPSMTSLPGCAFTASMRRRCYVAMTHAPGNAWVAANFSMSMQQGKYSFAVRTTNFASPSWR